MWNWSAARLKRALISLTLPVLAACSALILLTVDPATSQTSTEHPAPWEIAAGGKMAFDVASVKRNLEPYPPDGTAPHSNFPLGSDEAYAMNGGLFVATKWPLYVFIGFAYKLSPYELSRVQQELPKWAAIEHFDIEARGPASATKDQMRLMMQSLLARRFRLAVHKQAQRIPVYDVVEDKPGRLGSSLQRHTDDQPCATSSSSAQQASASQLMPCGTMSGHFFSGRMHVEGRGLTLDQLAGYLQQMQMPALDRPVLDATQLSGTYDFTLEWTPEGPVSLNGAKAQLDETGPSFIEALKEQLGLRLVAGAGSVDVLVVDHVEEPSAN